MSVIFSSYDRFGPSTLNQLELLDTYDVLNGALRSKGYHVLETSNPDTISDLSREMGAEKLNAVIDPRNTDYTSSTGFWLFVMDNATPVCSLGVRLDDLSNDQNIGDFWRRSLQRVHASGRNGIVGAIDPIIESDIKGKVAYYGGMFRNVLYKNEPAVIKSLSHLTMLFAHMKWLPDWHVAFVKLHRAEIAMRLYGFCRISRYPVEWLEEVDGRSNAEAVLSLNKSEASVLCNRIRRLEF